MIWIAGPCVIESFEVCERVLSFCKDLAVQHKLSFFFKASFDKANRTSIHSFRGPGLKKGLTILYDLKKKYDVAVTTDVHEVDQVTKVAEVVDVIQIPAFLCRQTDLLVAAGATGKPVNVKKGQFMDPANMGFVIDKVRSSGGEAPVWLTERGSCFGYDRLVVDFGGVVTMKDFGVPVIFDATHSVQMPGGGRQSTAGRRQHIPALGAAAVAAGCDGIFTEVHPDPDHALSDGSNLLSFEEMAQCMLKWNGLWRHVNPLC